MTATVIVSAALAVWALLAVRTAVKSDTRRGCGGCSGCSGCCSGCSGVRAPGGPVRGR